MTHLWARTSPLLGGVLRPSSSQSRIRKRVTRRSRCTPTCRRGVGMPSASSLATLPGLVRIATEHRIAPAAYPRTDTRMPERTVVAQPAPIRILRDRLARPKHASLFRGAALRTAAPLRPADVVVNTKPNLALAQVGPDPRRPAHPWRASVVANFAQPDALLRSSAIRGRTLHVRRTEPLVCCTHRSAGAFAWGLCVRVTSWSW